VVRARGLLPTLVGGLMVASCAAPSDVSTQEASRTPTSTTPDTAPPETTVTETLPPLTLPPDTDPPETDPTETDPPDSDPQSTTTTVEGPPASAIFDLGDAKPQRDYDEFLQQAFIDVQNWWLTIYPDIYGEEFPPLSGGVFPAYPGRTDPIPGCGQDRATSYREVREFAAFYCANGDFIVYDDGDEGILFSLADEFGASILGVVLAHEFGHTVQARTGALQSGSPTIVTEQQADCFAGAWTGRAARGEAEGIALTDEDVRSGLVAMITVRDPAGTDQFSDGGHGSAFDRVGAFQLGFVEGPQRCADLIDNPLPLVPNVYRTLEDQANQGNLPFGYGQGEIVPLVVDDLNAYWPTTVAAEGGQLGPLTLTPVSSADEAQCGDLVGDLSIGAALCPSTAEVFLAEPLARDLHAEFGDFAVGYMLGTAWSDAAQLALGSELQGEPRALATDCFVGAWVATIIPDETGTTPGGRGASVSPGDLDEAIQTALVVGDDGAGDDIVGSGFEKIASFRDGVLDGLPACTELLQQ